MSQEKVHKVRKRNRKYTVCTECRNKKIKCDKGNPCSNCKRSNLQCIYIAPKGKQMIEDSLGINEGVLRFSNPQDDMDLRSQINELKVQLDELKSQKVRSNIPSIIDLKLPELKRTAVFRKPSRTLFLGPTSQYSVVFFKAGRCAVFAVRLYHTTLGQNRRAYKKEHPNHKNLAILSDSADSEDYILRQINLLLVPNIAAMQERLLYMQDHLSLLLYRGFMPMDVVFQSFIRCFPGEHLPFEKPKKPYLFVDLALITALIFTVIIFTRYSNSPTAKFSHPMTCEPDALINLSMQLLNYSDFRRKRTQQAVLTLLVLKDVLCNFDNAEGANGPANAEGANGPANAYPLFQLALNNALQMGLHRDLRGDGNNYTIVKDAATYRSRIMTPSQEKILWNYLVSQDTYFSVVHGSMILIDYRFCDEFYNDAYSTTGMAGWAKAVQVLRNTCMLMNSRCDISLRDILGLIDDLLAFTKTLPIGMFRNEVQLFVVKSPNELVACLETKLVALQLMQCLCGAVANAVEWIMNKHNPSDSEKEELGIIIKRAHERVIIIGALLTHHVQYICDGQNIFETEPDGTHIIFLRGLLTNVLSQAMRFSALTMILTDDTQGVNPMWQKSSASTYEYMMDKDIAPWQGEITTKLLENVLYGPSSSTSESVTRRLLTIDEFIRFATPLYNAMAKHRCIRDSMDSFLALKFIIMLMSVMQTIKENRELFSGGNYDPEQLLELAKDKLRRFNEGVADVTLQLNVEQEDLETLFNTWFKTQNFQSGQVFQDISIFGDATGVDDIDEMFEDSYSSLHNRLNQSY